MMLSDGYIRLRLNKRRDFSIRHSGRSFSSISVLGAYSQNQFSQCGSNQNGINVYFQIMTVKQLQIEDFSFAFLVQAFLDFSNCVLAFLTPI